MISFDPLWKTMAEKKVSKMELCKKTEISRSTLAKMAKNEKVALDVIERICEVLDCQIQDVVSIKKS